MDKIPVSRGNHKIGKDTIIFNICSATDCPSKPLGFCQIPDKCYAMKAERMYKQSLPYRRRQEQYWDNHTADEIIEAFEYELNRKTKVKPEFIRLGESGDFRSQADVDKWFEVCKGLMHRADIMLYVFTARKDLDFSQRPINCIVTGSGFMIDNSFTVIPKEQKGMHEWECGGDCRTCDICHGKNGYDIKVVIH